MTAGGEGKPLSGKVALVAGATRGAGRAIAVELARAGAVVYATGRSSRVAGPSEVGRPETALASDPQVARWSGHVVSTGQLAPVYGVTDTVGPQPACWRYVVEVQDKGLPANDHGYR